MNRTILMVQLWDKVKTLLSEKLTVAQVSRILGIDRKTVRKYRDMSQEQISALVDNEVKRRLCKLEAYRDFTVNLLKEKPMLSSPQVHDRLLEHYPDFPDVSSQKEALDMFYKSETCRRFHDEETGLYLQGNLYVLNDFLAEISKQRVA